MAECPSRFMLASFKVGELEEAAAGPLVAHLEDCAACREALDALSANIASYESNRPAHLARLMSEINEEEKRAATRRFRIRSPATLSIFGGLAAAVAIALFILVLVERPREAADGEAIRFKGLVSLDVVAKRKDRQFRVGEGTRLVENDALRFVVTTGSAGYLYLFSVDGRGKVSSFYPESDPAADPDPMPIRDAGRHELPGSVILDDAVGRERFALVFSREPFDRAEVLGYMTADEADGADGAMDERSFKSPLEIQIVSITKEKKAGP